MPLPSSAQNIKGELPLYKHYCCLDLSFMGVNHTQGYSLYPNKNSSLTQLALAPKVDNRWVWIKPKGKCCPHLENVVHNFPSYISSFCFLQGIISTNKEHFYENGCRSQKLKLSLTLLQKLVHRRRVVQAIINGYLFVHSTDMELHAQELTYGTQNLQQLTYVGGPTLCNRL